MEYELIEAESAEELADKLRPLLAKGWRPWGGVAVAVAAYRTVVVEGFPATNEFDRTYAQAVVKGPLPAT
jgi:hypothetical protein